jgi:hypothetical protein
MSLNPAHWHRKIVQIAVTAGGEDNETNTLYALADDGSVWFMINPCAPEEEESFRRVWERVPEIPK